MESSILYSTTLICPVKYTPIKQMPNPKEKIEYISLQEATKYCDYSQEYLSLRARQGKLKSIKLGRNWVTKIEWLKEYLEKVEEYSINFNGCKEPKFVAPPVNLPVEQEIEIYQKVKSKEFSLQGLNWQTNLSFALVLALLFCSALFFKSSPLNVFDPKKNTLEIFEKSINQNFITFYQNLNKFNQQLGYVQYQQASLESEGKGFFRDILSFGEEIVQSYKKANNFVEEKIYQGITMISNLGKKKETIKLSSGEFSMVSEKEGVIVVPVDKGDEEINKKTLENLKNSFSDEVTIEADETDRSGIIKPVFKYLKDQEYLFMMVPIKE